MISVNGYSDFSKIAAANDLEKVFARKAGGEYVQVWPDVADEPLWRIFESVTPSLSITLDRSSSSSTTGPPIVIELENMVFRVGYYRDVEWTYPYNKSGRQNLKGRVAYGGNYDIIPFCAFDLTQVTLPGVSFWSSYFYEATFEVAPFKNVDNPKERLVLGADRFDVYAKGGVLSESYFTFDIDTAGNAKVTLKGQPSSKQGPPDKFPCKVGEYKYNTGAGCNEGANGGFNVTSGCYLVPKVI